jgi:hypothetical protein
MDWLMEVMRQREDSRQLTGRVEIDDAYLGGESTGGKTGRGADKKVPAEPTIIRTALQRERSIATLQRQ